MFYMHLVRHNSLGRYTGSSNPEQPPFVALLTYRAYGYPFLLPLRHNGASAMDNIRQDQMVAFKGCRAAACCILALLLLRQGGY
jgi:hypothetical protein